MSTSVLIALGTDGVMNAQMWQQTNADRTQETHTGNNGVDERGQGTTTRTVHNDVLLVCRLQGGDSKRQPVYPNGPDHNNVNVHDITFVWRPQTDER